MILTDWRQPWAPFAFSFLGMTSILKGLAALIAVVTVNVSGAHIGLIIRSAQHPAVVLKAPPAGTTNTIADPESAESAWLRARPQARATPTPIPVPVAAPVEVAPTDQSSAANLAQPPIAAALAPRPAPPVVVVGSTQQALINQDRAAAGLGPLSWNGCLAGVAYQNSLRMARALAVSHAGGTGADLGCGVGGQAGENVGFTSGGINDGQLNAMFMNSAGHRANILGPYHFIGTSWAVGSNGAGYVAVEFS